MFLFCFTHIITRNHLTPVACRIRESKNVGYAIQRCLSGTLRDDEEISNFISQTKGTKLKFGSRLDNGMSRQERIASKILNEDVTFEVETRQEETYRGIVLWLTISNWRSHAGGSSFNSSIQSFRPIFSASTII